MKILVTGGAGYVGSVLVPVLIDRGYEVRVVDKGFFGTGHLPGDAEVIVGDVLQFDVHWLDDVDAVIHLAGISNDPMAEFSPELNYTVNAAGAAIVAQAAKRAGVSRVIFASTCSVYGFSDGEEVDEEQPVSPCFAYAISKLMGERALLCLSDDKFRPIILRKGTVVGWSPRMRYDLVANSMVMSALTKEKIVVHNPSLWRPLIDVRDASSAYLRALDADLSVTGVFNIAYENYTIGRLADEAAAALKECGSSVPIEIQRRQDVRNYRVSTRKAHQVLDFQPTITMNDCVKAMMQHIMQGDANDFDNPRYYNVEWLKRLVAGGEVS